LTKCLRDFHRKGRFDVPETQKGRRACREPALQQPRARAKGKGSRGPRQKNRPG
jgi:hypothetical protein